MKKIITSLLLSLIATAAIATTPNPTYTPFVTDDAPGRGYFGNDVNAVFITDDSQFALLLQKATTNPATTAGANFAGTFPTSLTSISFGIDPKNSYNYVNAPTSPAFLITDTKGNKYQISLSVLIAHGTKTLNFRGTIFTQYSTNLSSIPLAAIITKSGEKALTNPPATIALVMAQPGQAAVDFIYLNQTLTLGKP